MTTRNLALARLTRIETKPSAAADQNVDELAETVRHASMLGKISTDGGGENDRGHDSQRRRR